MTACRLVRLRKRFAAGLAGALVVCMTLSAQPVAYAASITVTTTQDELNQDGDCSLREAVRAANLNTAVDACRPGSGTDVITLPAGTYSFALDGREEDAAATGDLDIRDNLTIAGASADTTVIDGARRDRVLHIMGGVRATLTRLTVSNGDIGEDGDGGGIRNKGVLRLEESTVGPNFAGHYGGGIWSDGTLEVIDSRVINNSASMFLYPDEDGGDNDGGGIYIAAGTATIVSTSILDNRATPTRKGGDGGGIFNKGTLTIVGSTVSGNAATNDDEDESDRSDGGGIYNAGTLTISDSSLRDNQVVWGQGGGISNLAGAKATIRGVIFYRNHAEFGGSGVRNLGSMEITSSSFDEHRNTTALNGGLDDAGARSGVLTIADSSFFRNLGTALINLHTLRVSNSTFENNEGAGIENGGPATVANSIIRGNRAGGIAHSGGTLRLIGSTLVDNSAEIGGGVLNLGGTVEITNSTISGNRATDSGGGIYNSPYAWMEGVSSVTLLNNVTIAFNTADSDNSGAGRGGGIFNGLYTAGNRIRVKNTIVARNLDGSSRAPDCYGRLSSYGYNLIQSTRGCAISNIMTGIRTGLDPRLGPLEANGGPTPTRALLPGSPAIDRGHPGSPGSGGNTCVRTDQRGLRRPRDGDGTGGTRCDIGAFERQSATAEVFDAAELTGVPAEDVAPPDELMVP